MPVADLEVSVGASHLLIGAHAPWQPAHSYLLPPPANQKLFSSATEDEPVAVRLITHDRFNNKCTRGRLAVTGRLQLVKQIKKDQNESSTLLMPNNHSVSVCSITCCCHAFAVRFCSQRHCASLEHLAMCFVKQCLVVIRFPLRLSVPNKQVTVEDMNDGTYLLKIAIRITAMVKLFVQMDKNLGAAGELPPLTLSFYPDDEVATTTDVAGLSGVSSD